MSETSTDYSQRLTADGIKYVSNMWFLCLTHYEEKIQRSTSGCEQLITQSLITVTDPKSAGHLCHTAVTTRWQENNKSRSSLKTATTGKGQENKPQVTKLLCGINRGSGETDSYFRSKRWLTPIKQNVFHPNFSLNQKYTTIIVTIFSNLWAGTNHLSASDTPTANHLSHVDSVVWMSSLTPADSEPPLPLPLASFPFLSSDLSAFFFLSVTKCSRRSASALGSLLTTR